jgi:hypothetical protein
MALRSSTTGDPSSVDISVQYFFQMNRGRPRMESVEEWVRPKANLRRQSALREA